MCVYMYFAIPNLFILRKNVFSTKKMEQLEVSKHNSNIGNLLTNGWGKYPKQICKLSVRENYSCFYITEI